MSNIGRYCVFQLTLIVLERVSVQHREVLCIPGYADSVRESKCPTQGGTVYSRLR